MRRLACVTAALLCVCGAAFADEASNRDAATRDAAGALTLLRLPEGAVRVDQNPAADPRYLDRPFSAPASPNLTTQTEFWRVPGKPWDLFAWLKKHPPEGTRIAVSGSGGNRDGLQFWGVSFERPPIREVMQTRQLAISLAKANDGNTALRADGLAIWIVPRPPSEQIPAGAERVRVTITGLGSTAVTRFAVSNPKQIALITRALNRLPLVQPGVLLCPLSRGVHARLTFRGSDGSVLADADASLDGCPSVDLALRGEKQPALASWTLFDDLEAALGRPIDLTPFSGSGFMSPPVPVARVAHGRFGGVPFEAVARNEGPAQGLCVHLFLAGVDRGSGCLPHPRGTRTTTFAAPACIPRELSAFGVLGRNAGSAPVRFDDGRTVDPEVHTLPSPEVTTTIGLQGGHIVELKRPAKVRLGYRGPFAFGFRTGTHDLDTPWPLFSRC
jgi:hypothetical protein